MVPLIMGLAGVGLVGYGVKRATFGGESTALTDAQSAIFNHMLDNEKDPARFVAMSHAFRAAGRDAEADILEKRSKIRDLPPAVKKQRREIAKKALSSLDSDAIDQVAAAFRSEGCVGHAKTLEEYSAAVRRLPRQ